MKKFLFIVFAVSILSACNHSKVESNNVNAVEKASKNLFDLFQENVYLKENYNETKPMYIFTKLDDIKLGNIKVGKLISKEEIHPVFLRVDSELADKSKK